MIQVNDEPLDWREGMTIRDVLTARNYRFPLLVVTLDGELIPRHAYDGTPVPDGAVVKIVHLMSGG